MKKRTPKPVPKVAAAEVVEHATTVEMAETVLAAPGTKNLPPTTTKEEDVKAEGQRQINRVWEYTQSGIAIAVVAANIVYEFVRLFIKSIDPGSGKLLEYAFFLVIGFYFGRTNHARMGDTPANAASTTAKIFIVTFTIAALQVAINYI